MTETPRAAALPLPVRAFINYASDDRPLAQWLHDRLIHNGAASVWMDRAKIRGGDRWKNEIDRALWESQVVLSVITRASVDPSHEWVKYEQERGHLLLKRIIPCLFEDEKAFLAGSHLPALLKPLDFIPFADRESGFDRLVNEIRGSLRNGGPLFKNQAIGIRHAFIGRERDLAELNRLINEESLAPTGRKTIAIVGIGGMGKTMLADELVRRLAWHYPGGVLIESRAGNGQPAGVVLQRWAEEMERPLTRQYEPEEIQALVADIRARLAHYGEMLLLVDDVDETDVRETRLLLEAMPVDATRIFTTRREDIAVALSAVICHLEAMTDDDSLALLESRLRDRFASNHPRDGSDFDDELRKLRPALLELVRTVQGHPLALDLGIGTCDYPGQIPDQIDRLSDSIENGVDGFRMDLELEAADRNHSLARSLAVSLTDIERHDRLHGSDWVKRFRALGAYPDGARVSKRLLFATWGDHDASAAAAEYAIRGLIRRAMLRVDSEGAFSNHPVVRAYATGLLAREPDQQREVESRYARFVIDRAGDVLSKAPAEWHRYWLLIDHVQHVASHLVASLGRELGDFTLAARPDAPDTHVLATLRCTPRESLELGLSMAHAVEDYVIRRPEWGSQGLKCLELGLTCARALGLDRDAAGFMSRLGGALSNGQPRLAGAYFANGLSLARQNGDRALVGEILSYFGELERIRGHPVEALNLLREALEIHEALGNRTMRAKTLKYTGETLWRMSRLDEALEYYERARSIYEECDDAWGSADMLNKIGSVHFNRGDHETAVEFFSRAVTAHETVGNLSMQAGDFNDMGAAFRYLGRKELALDRFDKAIEMHVQLGNRRLESIARSNRAGVLMDLGRHAEAIDEAHRAIAIADDVGDPVPHIWALCWEGTALEGLGRYDDAEARFSDAVARVRVSSNPRGLAGVLGMYGALLGRFAERRDRSVALIDEAVDVLTQAHLTQAFGGRTIDELKELRAKLAS